MLVRQDGPDSVGHLGRVLLGDDTGVDQLTREQLADRGMLLDHLVHLGLGVGGLVSLVVAEAPVADEVDENVVSELLAEAEGEPDSGDAGGHVIGVDVDDRDIKALGQVRRPRSRARVVGVGGEPDLVVLDEMHGAAHGVAVQRLEVERLGDHALAGEGGVAVQDDRDRGVGVLVGVRALASGLRGPGRAGRDGGDELQVRRVGLQTHDDRLATLELIGALGAVVILDVPGAALGQRGDRLERRGALELGEDRLIGPAQVVSEDVEATTVGHADDYFPSAPGGGELGQLVDHRHRHVQALDRELLLPQVGLVHEALEGVDLGQPLEQGLLLVAGQRMAELPGLDRLAQPQTLAVRRDVLDLVGDRAAVGLVQVGQGLGKSGAGDIHTQDPGRDLGHQFGRQAQRLGIERRIALGLATERIEVGGQVAMRAVSLEQRGRGLNGLEQFLVELGRGGRGWGGVRRR